MRQRADRLLVERGLAESRARAQALIEAGLVESAGRPVAKPGQLLAADAPLAVTGRDHPWVSRGGVKLAHGLEHFHIDPAGLVCLDLGASTGGFTDVLLQRGAERVYAVDVGHGQLHPRLAEDPRVVSLEGVNGRALSAELVPEAPALLVCDASFISLETLLPAALALVRPGGRLVALVKPQFELGPGAVDRRGVVRDPAARRRACEQVVAWLEAQPGWRVTDLTESPIAGPEGNVEYLLAAELP
ncbi:23S rRNA (cytidine1920-2'-O)/16S rRNA (cytidine1409-2'-O)-methyltransferase [Tistlia consotensis]|uniref:23S rRNA (Cytidine1920-2'-O)/16S rRNA (Cytidine1409-2'-O)-methyltransferase n=1 Tax=Tistlia consotensis USBA 355 TaxID=560819 RepID=A0A1Y6CLK9_9PROT|nr:TlyA family RNA methyltransferase [Tistlia consotensis]SMF60742.1 23S rRNA (cytidine1920-2'-O)/16S rRNA (cytidine1409-2'-O)-methyltransferase [Tistlia consotensis USBA 355]SNR92867.1 23S rRNA (cytidine1920-2'-O)/16S rRNA (cytidine1409-2'-O)-methyltransferase [Tistlia consotensis]